MLPDNLTQHPEGGRFQEVYRSSSSVITRRGISRCAATHIYFRLAEGEVSRFHKVSSDEIWNLYRGQGVILYTWDGSDSPPGRIVVSAEESRFCHVVPAGTWQAAEPLSGEVLVGCTVAPGFEFADFTLMGARSPEARKLVAADPQMAKLIGE
ncbi:MAG: cupin domain-containing protein [Fibrobacterota bacterium]